MSRPSISRLSGEWGIKLKDKMKFLVKGVPIILLVIGCFCGLFYLADIVFDRRVGDMFEQLFLQEIVYGFDSEGNEFTGPMLRWTTLKNTFLIGCVIVLVVWIISIMIAISVTRKKTEKEAAVKAGKMVKRLFSTEEQGTQVFPDEYAELANYVSDLKAQIQHKEQALRDESAKKNDLIAYLAHDLKTPLTSVVGYLSLLEEAPDMPPEQKAKYVHVALDKALRLEQLINEFFEITRYNLHEIMLEKESIDLSYMLMQMADEFYPVLMEHGNTVTVSAEDGLTVVADSDKLARVFNNILKNAIAYSDRDTAIVITAARHEQTIQITFTNRGKTIPKLKLQSIFEKFYRLDDARSSNTGGAGLGLAIAKEIVTLHGGTISATSENQVTTFTVEMPI